MRDLLEQATTTDGYCLWHPYTQHASDQILKVAQAKGAVLTLSDGRQLIDAISSWWVTLHGHTNPQIAQGIAEQAQQLEQVIFSGFTHQAAIDAANSLLSILPSGQEKIFLSDNGSTAVEVALKIALQYWESQGEDRTRIIALKGAYHGETFGSMSLSSRSTYNKPFWNKLFQVDFIDLEQEDYLEYFSSLLKGTAPAAFIYEPLIQAAYGMRIYDCERLDNLLALANQARVFCIADEVFTGFGRCGTYFASEQLQNKPDMICLSKGLSGGFLPLGATSVRKEIYHAFCHQQRERMFLHGHSFTGNALACRAASISIDLLKSQQCSQQRTAIFESHHHALQKLRSHPAASNVRLLGTILALDLKLQTKIGYHSQLREQIYKVALDSGVLLRPLAETIYCVPPYCISAQELTKVYQAFEAILDCAKKW